MQAKAGKEHKKEEKQEDFRALAQEYKETLQRLQAEFENSRKRSEKEQGEFTKFANSSLLKEFLPLVDSILEAKKASETGPAKLESFAWKHGGGTEALDKIGAQLMKILERNGVRIIETTGKKFDFNVHECLLTSHEKEKEDGIILEELQKGYMLNGKVLRPAKVRVNKKTE